MIIIKKKWCSGIIQKAPTGRPKNIYICVFQVPGSYLGFYADLNILLCNMSEIKANMVKMGGGVGEGVVEYGEKPNIPNI